MTETYQLQPIGVFKVQEGIYAITVAPAFRSALQGLEGFSHLKISWWFSELDSPEARSVLAIPQPYKGAPEIMGIFATRSPVRPNPLASTVVEVLQLDWQQGEIVIAYSDAHDQTPILDIKPYTPSEDRVETPTVPDWCQHWPKNVETSGDFDWGSEFNF